MAAESNTNIVAIRTPSLAASTRAALLRARYGVQEDGSGIPRGSLQSDSVSISASARERAARLRAGQGLAEVSEDAGSPPVAPAPAASAVVVAAVAPALAASAVAVVAPALAASAVAPAPAVSSAPASGASSPPRVS